MVMKGNAMVMKAGVMAMTISIAIMTFVAVQAQQRGSRRAPTLTPADYIQIQQLVARYSYALDTGADNGYAYADLFAPGATFGNGTTGRENLAASARQGGGHYPRGPLFVFHYVTNHVIEPSPEGAIGKVYVVEIDAGEGRKTALIEDGGHYDDVYVKTPQGWLFKSRKFVKSQPGTPPAHPRPEQ
jgi:hypothetical protein